MIAHFGGGAVGPIGIDLGASRIVACQLRRGGARRVAAALEIAPRAEDIVDELPRLVRILARRGFRDAPVVLGANDADVTIAELSLPAGEAGAPIREIVGAQLAKLRQAEPAALESCWWRTQSEASGAPTRSLAVAYATELGVRLVEAFDRLGVEVAAIEPRAVAIARACKAFATKGLEIIVDVERTRAQMVLVERGDVSYVRTLERRAGRTAKGSVEALPLDAFLADLRLTLGYLGHRHPNVEFARVLLVGGGAEDPTVAEAIRTSLEVEAVRVGPEALVAEALRRPLSSGAVAALGLAARSEDGA